MNKLSKTILIVVCLTTGGVIGSVLTHRLDLQAQAQVAPKNVIPAEITSYRDIVKAAAPAVVSIEARVKQRAPARPNVMLRDVPDDVQATQMPLGFGSGVIIDPKGVIVTNFHVVEGADSLEVRLPDGRKFISSDWKSDRKTDLAIIRVQSDKALPFLEFGDSDKMEVGDRVLAIGAPFGLSGSVTHGIISAKSRNVRLNQYEDFLQTDAAINPGNSGGALISLDGKLIGINSAIKSKSGGFQGVGLAISSNLTKTIMQQLLKNGAVKRGYLGVQIRDLEGETAAKLGVKEYSGVLVTKVFDQSPAFQCGLKLNDIVESIGGKPIRDGIELQKVVGSLPLNQPLDVVLKRDGKSLLLKLTILEQPEEFGIDTPKSNN